MGFVMIVAELSYLVYFKPIFSPGSITNWEFHLKIFSESNFSRKVLARSSKGKGKFQKFGNF